MYFFSDNFIKKEEKCQVGQGLFGSTQVQHFMKNLFESRLECWQPGRQFLEGDFGK